MQHPTTLDIPDSGECPECGYKHGDWTPYMCPKEGEIGVFCPICYTHFANQELSLEEFG